ncbi:unnamed protein product [Adineta steineri]|uniref:Uncharacterized protein n=1 Tax=Adineta steineri TaxID=433720 RepID=A0A815A404_9BILA|nr:unnamed protein product [Adineta steineri]CAF3870595.1 unnamed protein product [Adineta steineri]
MTIPSILITEAYKIFKDKWKTQPGDNFSGDRWSVAIIKEENKGLQPGPSEKETHAYVVVHDKDNNIQETKFDASSHSWVDNLHQLYPKINTWVQGHTGVDPNLS